MFNILLFWLTISNLLLSHGFDKITNNQVVNAIKYWKYYKKINIEPGDIVDMDMKGTNYAYTLTSYKPYNKQIIAVSTIFIDSKMFIKAPLTLYNVLLHEIGHYIGKSHNNDAKSIMNYSIKVDADSKLVIEDRPRFLGSIDICD